MKKIFFLLLVFLISGCATIWTHPTKTSADFNRDYYKCERIATEATENWGYPGNPFIIANEIKKCLQMECGWQPQ